MTHSKAPTPRLIFIRHGETEWSQTGQYTSSTDLPLLKSGVRRMRSTAQFVISTPEEITQGRALGMVNPYHLTHVFSSPLLRATQTRDIILQRLNLKQHPELSERIKVDTDEDITEWRYGEYEGLLTSEIRAIRNAKGLNSPQNPWNIWRDGCEGGEEFQAVTARLDRFIAKVRKLHAEALQAGEPCDILVVAHGHILRALARRWTGGIINDHPHFILNPGGVGVLSYEHGSIDEPAMVLGGFAAYEIASDEE